MLEHWNIQRSLRGQESPRKKYDRAGLTGKEKLAVFFAAGAAAGITAVLFYQSWFGMPISISAGSASDFPGEKREGAEKKASFGI